MKKLFFILTLFTFQVYSQETLPADISFMVADFKYNSVDGIKICEVQQGIISKFEGYDRAYEGKGLMAQLFYSAIEPWNDHLFFIQDRIADENIVQTFLGHRGVEIQSIEDLGVNTPPSNPKDICSYNGLLFSRSRKLCQDKNTNLDDAGVLIMDRASFPTEHSKLLMSQLFDQDPVLKSYKPGWKSYPTKYSKKLADQIINDLNSEIVVIKPVSASMGKGVILVHKNNLDQVLKLIFKEKNKLGYLGDPAYLYWAKSKDERFIAEQFFSSDPINVPHLKNNMFDGTMRTAFLLIYHNDEITVKILDSYWNLPFHPVDSKGTLNQKHKTDYLSVGDYHFSAKVSEETSTLVHKELEQILPLLYKKMLQR